MFAPDSLLWTVPIAVLFVFFFAGAVKMLRNGGMFRFAFAVLGAAAILCAAAGWQINYFSGYAKSWEEAKTILAGENGAAGPPVAMLTAPAHSAENKMSAQGTFLDTSDLGSGSNSTDTLYRFRGRYSGIEQKVRIWAPAGWQEKKNLHVMFLLHGFPANPGKVFSRLQADTALSQPGLENTILVMPETRPDPKEPDCVDFKDRPKVGTWILKDVVEVVRDNFPVSADSDDWSIGGVSAGAYCSGILAAKGNSLFGRVIFLSGYDDPAFGGLRHLSEERQRPYRITQALSDAAKKRKKPLKVFAFASGTDRDAIGSLNGLLAVKNNNLQVKAVYYRYGGHNWQTWSRAFSDAGKWLAGREPSHTRTRPIPISRSVLNLPVVFGAVYALTLIGALWMLLRTGRKNRASLPRRRGAKSPGMKKAAAVTVCAMVYVLIGFAFLANLQFETVSSFADLRAVFQLLH